MSDSSGPPSTAANASNDDIPRCPMLQHVEHAESDTEMQPANKRQRLESNNDINDDVDEPQPTSSDVVVEPVLVDPDQAERDQLHEQLRDFDLLDEVHGDEDDDADDDDDDEDDHNTGEADDSNSADRRAAAGLYDESSDTDLEGDSGLELARRREAAVAKKRAACRQPNPAENAVTDQSQSEAAATAIDNGGDGDVDSIDLNEDELEELLNEGLPEDMRQKKTKIENQYEEKFKTVLVEMDQNHFEVLPEGWVQVTHNSGIPLYLHTASRVCSATRPYFLGPGSVRKHEIPVSAIACYAYRRQLEKEHERAQQLEAARLNASAVGIPAGHPNIALIPLATQAVIQSVAENRQSESLSADQITEYCRKLFRFKQVRVMRFRSWQARRKFTKSKKQIKNLQRPTLPAGTKLISFPILHAPMPAAQTPQTAAGQSDATNDATNADASDSTASAPCTTSAATSASAAAPIPVANHPRQRREWIMNPNGKSYVCILHEYVQHALKKQPTYEFKELENAAAPYSATVSINELKYGTGFGTSKKQAKSEAARETLEVLIPEMKGKITGTTAAQAAAAASSSSSSSSAQKPQATCAATSGARKPDGSDGTAAATASSAATAAADTSAAHSSVFDEIAIEDSRVTEFCSKTTEPLPHAILLTCLQRNYGLGEVQISYHVNTTKHKRNEFTMTVGKHSVTVACKNKRDGKHRAAQSILQILHPHVRTWGSLLRLYGNRSVKSFKEKKQEEQEITVLQSRAAINQPNYAILDKLRLEMTKLMERRAAVKPIGTFRPPTEVDLPAASGSGLNNVQL